MYLYDYMYPSLLPQLDWKMTTLYQCFIMAYYYQSWGYFRILI